MTLITMTELVQGTEEWAEQRRGIVTASVADLLVTPSTVKVAENVKTRALTAHLVAERITGASDESYVSDDMFRGILDEPAAREVYAEKYGVDVTTAGFMVRDDWGFPIGYSPDGLVGSEGLLEIKSRRQKKHLQTILANEVPLENIGQCQAALLVSGREWIDYVSYCAGMPLFVKRVEPDPKWRAALVEAVRAFELAARQMTAAYLEAVKDFAPTERVNYSNEVELKL